MNGQQFSSSGVSFTYRPACALSSVWPVRGASEGGTPVTVVGSGFSLSAESEGALRCRFNATSVVASYVSESSLVCNTTASSAGYVPVEVSTNGHEYTSSGVRFELVSLLVTALLPFSGPTLGGTVVTIAGTRLSQLESMRCTFGVASLPASSSLPASLFLFVCMYFLSFSSFYKVFDHSYRSGRSLLSRRRRRSEMPRFVC